MNVDALSKQQILELLACARAFRQRDWLMILVAYLHGLRATEVVSIKRVHLHDGFLTVARGKRSETTCQPLLASENSLLNERQPLIEYAAKASPIHPVFHVTRGTFWNVLQRHGQTAGIPAVQCHPHILKHSCGTHMYEKTKSLPAVQKWLGHVSGASTMIYMQMSQADAANAAQGALCG